MTAAYAATKAYVLSLGLALHEELKGTGVTVTTLCPGTDGRPGSSREPTCTTLGLIRGRELPSAREVAEAGYAAMKRGRPYLVTGAQSRLFAFGTRFLPRTAASAIAGRSQERTGG